MRQYNKKISLAFMAIFTAILTVSFCTSALCAPKKFNPEFQKGVCYVALGKDSFGTARSDESLKAVKALGANWVAIVPNWYQDTCATTDIFPNDKTATDESVVHAIQTAHSLGLKVMLKPHLDILDTTNGDWRGDIACVTEPDWQAWFESYKEFALHYAKIAQDNNVELFCFGTELVSVSTIKGDMWESMVIKPIRENYKGLITYAANWSDEYTHVKFWHLLDYVGIDAYFPLNEEKDRPSFEELKKGWEGWLKEIEEFQKTVNKPIIFAEIGYCSAQGTAKRPWEDIAGGEVDMALQADCYQSVFETFWDKPWFYGVYWWKWGTNINFGGPNNRGFTPQNKIAEKIVAKWYKKPVPRKAKF